MTNSIFRFISAIVVLILLSCAAFGQLAKLSPFLIKPSTLLEDLRNQKNQNPKITPEELAQNANALLAARGFNFIFDFDQTTCQKIADARRNPKNAGAPIRLNARFLPFEGEPANVVLPESQTAKSECGICSVALPVLEIAPDYFITTIENRNIKFHTPSNFIANEVFLVDAKSPNTTVRSWKIPFRAAPLSVSEDGKIIFLELPAPELKDLLLSVYDNGALQFYAKSEIDLETKAVPAVEIAKQANAANFSFVSFGAGDKMKVLKFAAPCQ